MYAVGGSLTCYRPVRRCTPLTSRPATSRATRRICCASETSNGASAPAAPSNGVKQPNFHVTAVSVGDTGTYRLNIETDSDILELKTLRHLLRPRSSPFAVNQCFGGGFVGDTDKVRLNTLEFESQDSAGAICVGNGSNDVTATDDVECLVLPDWVIRSGPRKTIYYDPSQVTAAIVTCGGLCPGLNDVVQNIACTLLDYGVPEDNILGIKYGLRGFYERDAKPIVLTRKHVDGIHLKGGTILGTSRGGANIKEIVKRIDLWGLDMVFVVGGNGGNAAANAIQEECERSNVKCSIVGVPKSIDNDILLVDKCFGFDTAVEEAQRALLAAKVEAKSARKGLGVVKLMGRQSGFIAMQASMAVGVVDCCLIPEIPFEVEPLMNFIESIIEKKGHAVVCVAEGAGQDILASKTHGFDASGNPILADIGTFLRDEFKRYFKGEADVKYIDPTYMIRAIPTTSNDRIYCKVLGQGAVHGAFAGFTGFTVGLVNTHYVYLPIPVIISAPRTVNPRGRRWNRLMMAINQPPLLKNEEQYDPFDVKAMVTE